MEDIEKYPDKQLGWWAMISFNSNITMEDYRKVSR